MGAGGPLPAHALCMGISNGNEFQRMTSGGMLCVRASIVNVERRVVSFLRAVVSCSQVVARGFEWRTR